MITRLSKIARLPKTIRQQLNRRLENGELGRTILPWVNELPRTKKVLADIFNAKPITHQNLSEWRATGYQDWLMQQERKDWFSTLNEQNTELDQHDACSDTYEALSRFFLFEIGRAMQAAQKIKNPDTRWERMERLADKFARLQNSYNWSRRVALEFDKCNGAFNPELPTAPEIESACQVPQAGGASVLASRAQPETENEDFIEAEEIRDPKRQGAGALQDAPRNSGATDQRASVLDCASPLPLSREEPETPTSTLQLEPAQNANPPSSDLRHPASVPNSSTPKLADSQTPPKCHPIPTLTPTPLPPNPNSSNPQLLNSLTPQQPPTWKTHKVYSIPVRSRRFTGVEG